MDVTEKKLTIRVALYEMIFIVVVDNDVKSTICETRQAQVIKTFLSTQTMDIAFSLNNQYLSVEKQNNGREIAG